MSFDTATMADDDTKVAAHPPTWLGWAVRLLSLALLGVLVAVLVFEATQPEKDIAFDAKPQFADMRQDGATWLLPVEVTNRGTRTAHVVRLKATDGREDRTIEIDMLGQEESATYVLGFSSRPTTLETTIESYQAP